MRKPTINSLKRHLERYIPIHFIDKPGTEAYSLYLDYALGLDKGARIADLGTYEGLSALAFSGNKSISVNSYDITLEHNLVKDRKNITFIEGDIFEKKNLDNILKCDLILVDVDPHNGIQEQKFLDILIEKGYKGITLWDDIHLNLGMKNFWHKVKLPKEDLTAKGHHSGTGLIVFE